MKPMTNILLVLKSLKFTTLRAVAISTLSIISLLAQESSAQQNQGTSCSRPQILISSATKAGSFYSDEFTIAGRIVGKGVIDAGVFVGEQRINTFPIEIHPHKPINSRFQVTIDASEEPEIRLLTQSGQTLIEKIDVLDYRG